MTEKQDFGRRLGEAMTAAGYAAKGAVLEREFNTRYWGRSVTLQAVRRWLRGEAIPSQDKLQVLADWLRIEPEVLRFGDVVQRSVRERRKRWDEGAGFLEREAFDAFLQLPAPQRKIVREVILAFSKAHGDGSEAPVSKKTPKG